MHLAVQKMGRYRTLIKVVCLSLCLSTHKKMQDIVYLIRLILQVNKLIWNIKYLNYRERYEDMIDHYMRN